MSKALTSHGVPGDASADATGARSDDAVVALDDVLDATAATVGDAPAGSPDATVAPSSVAPTPSSPRGEPGDALACSICLEPTAMGGPHQIASLACGHCFGHSCIFEWLDRKKRGNGGKCPQCNVKAKTADIRKLFVPSFHTFVDTTELDESRAELKRERAGRIEAEANLMRVSQRLRKVEKDLADAVRERAAAEEATKAAKYTAAKAEARAAKVADDVAGDGPSQPTAFDVLRPSVGDKRKPARETRADPEDTTQRTVLRMFDPYREGIDETFSQAERRRERDARERENRADAAHEVSLRGAFVKKGWTRVESASAHDVDARVAAVAARGHLIKVSLRAPDMRARVALPPGCGAARDVRLSGGGASALAPGPATALVASLGNRLSVVDLERDHVAASIALRAPAWSCAWGGWCVGAPRILSDGVAEAPNAANDPSSDPSTNAHLVTVGAGDGTVALYDLRRAAAPLAEIRAGRTPVHAVYPVSRASGGGVLFADVVAVHRASDEGTEKIFDATGTVSSASYGSASRALAFTSRRRAIEPAREACHTFAVPSRGDGGVMRHGDVVADRVPEPWRGAGGEYRKTRVDIEQPPGLSRGTLTRANVSKFPALYAYGTMNASGASIVGLWSAESGEKRHDIEHVGGERIVDVRGWCGATGSGGGELLTSLSAGVLQLCTWQPDG